MDFIPKVKNMDVNEETGEENPNFIYEDDEVEDFESYEDEVQSKEEFIPQPVKKVVEEESIFEDDEPPKKAKPKKEPKSSSRFSRGRKRTRRTIKRGR